MTEYINLKPGTLCRRHTDIVYTADEPVDNNDIIYHLKDPAGRVMWRFATP